MLFDFYKIVSPYLYEHSLSILPTEQDRINHTLEAVNEGLQVWIPQNSPNMGSECIKQLIERFPLPKTPVTYTAADGRRVRTKKPILLGSLYMVSLEKIGDDWGATSIPKRQHHGVPGKLTDTDKNSLPWRDQAFKKVGESEMRLFLGVLEPSFVASIANFPNSPAMCTEVAETILTAEEPTNIEYAMNYRKHIETTGRSAQYLKHILGNSGIKIVQGDPIE